LTDFNKIWSGDASRPNKMSKFLKSKMAAMKNEKNATSQKPRPILMKICIADRPPGHYRKNIQTLKMQDGK